MSADSPPALAGALYRLSHRWRIEGPIDTVYYYLTHGRTFPEWWPVFRDVETDADEVAVGSRSRFRVRALLPYRLDWECTIARLDTPFYLELDTRVTLGGWFRLAGPIRFHLTQQGPVVEVRNEQELRAANRLPAPLLALATRAFAFNHARAMATGERGLQRAVRAAAANAQPTR
jgi:uncharacterized protein YndB with AHSA1/START domain